MEKLDIFGIKPKKELCVYHLDWMSTHPYLYLYVSAECMYY